MQDIPVPCKYEVRKIFDGINSLVRCSGVFDFLSSELCNAHKVYHLSYGKRARFGGYVAWAAFNVGTLQLQTVKVGILTLRE